MVRSLKKIRLLDPEPADSGKQLIRFVFILTILSSVQ